MATTEGQRERGRQQSQAGPPAEAGTRLACPGEAGVGVQGRVCMQGLEPQGTPRQEAGPFAHPSTTISPWLDLAGSRAESREQGERRMGYRAQEQDPRAGSTLHPHTSP